MTSKKPFTAEELRHWMVQDKGLFSGELEWCLKDSSWAVNTLQINTVGQLTISYSLAQYAQVDARALKLGNSRILNLANDARSPNSNPYSDVVVKNLHSSEVCFQVNSGVPTIHVTSVGREQCFFRGIANSKEPFVRFVAALMVWQNMRVCGIHNKYFNIPLPFGNLDAKKKPEGASKVVNQSVLIYDESDDNNVIVINKAEKNLLVCRFKVYGPIAKSHRKSLEIPGPHNPLYCSDNSKDVHEGWFYAMGVVKSNGVLDLLSELDGTLLYSINVGSLLRSEIRPVHHSVFESSNVLFVGVIAGLRAANASAAVCSTAVKPPFFVASPASKFAELKSTPFQRILLSFPLHIDLEDWFVALQSLAAGEYVGVNSQYSAKTSCRISRKLKLDIIEANFDSDVTLLADDDLDFDDEGSTLAPRLYTDIILWDSVWARTSVVENENSTFWREEFDIDLPILTNSLQLVVKKCISSSKLALLSRKNKSKNGMVESQLYNDKDCAFGIVDINEEHVELSEGKEIWVPIFAADNDKMADPPMKIGSICVRIALKEIHLLLPGNFDVLQKMLVNTSLGELIEYLSSGDFTGKYEDLEEVSNMMLDIFQALHREQMWFGELIDFELKRLSKTVTNPSKASTNFFNTLFRGNSILSKTFEKYNLRVGQEFLEKVVGEFVLQVASDNYDCEIDPARIKAGNSEEKEAIIDENFMRLYDYVESIWEKIYNSCNDLPAPIRNELEIFREKLEKSQFFTTEVENKTEDGSSSTTISSKQPNALALNCITGFLFLRFICPAILNPKLFFLIKDHQTGKIKRTLTLVSKILLTLSNRTRFGAKEPWLIKMNYFLEQHEKELLNYLDIVTNRVKSDTEKILDLSDTVVRPDISISTQISLELPTNPFLIDKYLRLTQLATILSKELVSKQEEFTFGEMGTARNSVRNSYRIGSLKFEEQLSKGNAFSNASDDFLRSLSQINSSNVRASMVSNLNRISIATDHSKAQVPLADLRQESFFLLQKVNSLDHLLMSFEKPSLIYSHWDRFVDQVIETALIDHRKRLLYLNSFSNSNNVNFENSSSQSSLIRIDDVNLRRIVEDGIPFLKIKFNPKIISYGSNPGSTPSSPIKTKANIGTASIILGAPPKLGKLIKSASTNTLGRSYQNSAASIKATSRPSTPKSPHGRMFEEPVKHQEYEDAQNGSRSPFKKSFFWRKRSVV